MGLDSMKKQFTLHLYLLSIISKILILCIGRIKLQKMKQYKSNTYFLEPWENNDEYKEAVGIIDIDNEYTPKYLSVWLHNTILMHLKN